MTALPRPASRTASLPPLGEVPAKPGMGANPARCRRLRPLHPFGVPLPRGGGERNVDRLTLTYAYCKLSISFGLCHRESAPVSTPRERRRVARGCTVLPPSSSPRKRGPSGVQGYARGSRGHPRAAGQVGRCCVPAFAGMTGAIVRNINHMGQQRGVAERRLSPSTLPTSAPPAPFGLPANSPRAPRNLPGAPSQRPATAPDAPA
jgi:hypothetical protein